MLLLCHCSLCHNLTLYTYLHIVLTPTWNTELFLIIVVTLVLNSEFSTQLAEVLGKSLLADWIYESQPMQYYWF